MTILVMPGLQLQIQGCYDQVHNLEDELLHFSARLICLPLCSYFSPWQEECNMPDGQADGGRGCVQTCLKKV